MSEEIKFRNLEISDCYHHPLNCHCGNKDALLRELVERLEDIHKFLDLGQQISRMKTEELLRRGGADELSLL